MILNEQGHLGPSAASCSPCLQVCTERSESMHRTLQWSWVLMATLPVGRQMSRWGQEQHLWVGWHRVHNFHFKEFRASLLRVHCSLGLSTSQSYLWYNYSGWKKSLTICDVRAVVTRRVHVLSLWKWENYETRVFSSFTIFIEHFLYARRIKRHKRI